ncbi:hypothetical protein H0H87_000689 [Tephrocybe sp. NHM501043]|nr:hypothetical protein H0H87_000689 [Tephrocybe sp. NHM501043]
MTPNPVVAFIIGLAIILLASILNAAGLNLTKLDHVRTSAVPKSARKKDWMRPLWLLGMLLYILSQLIGSTLALEYMRAGTSSSPTLLSLLTSVQNTSRPSAQPPSSSTFSLPASSSAPQSPAPTSMQGTIVVILGVIGIVAFGSINSGLSSQTDVTHITYLWRRSGWLGFFFLMSGALLSLLVFAERLDSVLVSRAAFSSGTNTPLELPLSAHTDLPGGNARIHDGDGSSRTGARWGRRIFAFARALLGAIRGIRGAWATFMVWITGWLEVWTAPQDDKQVAWTLGIAWACCGGGLAGGTLVFAKATVKLLSGSLSKQNPGNQFGHAAPIFTIILLAATAVLQIICLNRGLKVYDSTLVVPVFYGVYTATGFLDSLIFNDEVDAYQGWTLFLIFVSILVLISGVVLLTHKKPEHTGSTPVPLTRAKGKARKAGDAEEGRAAGEDGEQAVLWAVGDDDSDEEGGHGHDDEDPDVDHHQNPIQMSHRPRGVQADKAESRSKSKERGKTKTKGKGKSVSWKVGDQDEEGVGLIGEDDEEEEYEEAKPIHHGSSLNSAPADPFKDEDEFGDWGGVTPAPPKQ